jgi:hypothetical protein
MNQRARSDSMMSSLAVNQSCFIKSSIQLAAGAVDQPLAGRQLAGQVLLVIFIMAS